MTRVLLVCVAALAFAGTAASAVAPGTIATVVGTGVVGTDGDGGPAASADINHPRGLALAPDGGFAFADAFGETVRRVWPDGTITTLAGTGVAGYSGDDGPATGAELDLPHGVAFTSTGALLIADTLNQRIRSISPDGTITTIAGTGVTGYSGDGGPATLAQISSPRGIAALPDGGFLIPDSDNQRVRRVSPDGTITTVAGTGVRGFSGDGGPATGAELDEPFGVAPTPDGGFLIADAGDNRIRRVAPDGTITTVAGDGNRAYGGDGGPATTASLSSPHNVAPVPDGGFLIADEGNNRVRRVWPDGTITTIAGTGEAGFSGDGGAPGQAMLNEPKGLLVLPTYDGFLVADAQNSRIRLVTVDLHKVLAVRVAQNRLRIRRGRDATLTFTVDGAATVELDVRLMGKHVMTLTQDVPAGEATLRFGSDLLPGSYRAMLVASAAGARPVVETLTLTVT